MQLSARFGVPVRGGRHRQPDACRRAIGVYQFTGDPDRARDIRARHAGLGARSPGARRRGDRAQLHGAATACAAATTSSSCARVRKLCRVPLVASGGAGAPEHFRDAFERGRRGCGAGRQRVSLRRHRHSVI